MTIMQQSSKADNRTLGVWFQQIQQGQIKLPSFQRMEAWDRARITSFLNTIISNLPVGVTLILEVGGAQKFVSRYISKAEPVSPGPVTQHLLDGQQRLTAFWRSMHNNYELETYFVYIPLYNGRRAEQGDATVQCVPRWENKQGLKMPRWADDPEQCLERGLIPISLLRPEDISNDVDTWVKDSSRTLKPLPGEADAFARLEKFNEFQDGLKKQISMLRERIKFFNLPCLSLPAETEKEVALQVFINMNTNSKPLALYDIIVAEVESATGDSLHQREASLGAKCPNASRYDELRDLILSTSALLQDKPPSNRGMIDMDKSVLISNWPKLERGLDRLAAFLEGQGIFDQARLPTNAVLGVIAASYEFIPDAGDFLANAEKLLRRYLWSSFFTDRYENTAATRAFDDFRAIKSLLQKQQFTEADVATVPVLNRAVHPLADADSLLVAGWPKARGIEARGILAVTTYLGANDFADNKKASFESIQHREYHHVFPDALLKEAGIPSFLALNCALITWKTNRLIGRKDPVDYLEERIEWAGVTEIEKRLKTHLIPYEIFLNAKYSNLQEAALKEKLTKDFNAFLRARAQLVAKAVEMLASGANPTLDAVWANADVRSV